ncbi:hypothetical protein C8R45DRAFT_1174147 [Mycena sanguinolenta]|nr:hypothetical protein C8R45DRAFT_1174147 [Mycena sanguinolenta]
MKATTSITEVEHLGTFRDELHMCRCLLECRILASMEQSRKAVNGRLRLTVYGQTRTVPVPYKIVSHRLTARLYTAVFLATVYGIAYSESPVKSGRAQTKPSRIFVHIAILMLYASSTVCAATLWIVAKNAFIQNTTPEDTLAYLVSSPLPKLPGLALPFNTFLADCILIWRCWEPLLRSLLLFAAVGFIVLVSEIRLDSISLEERTFGPLIVTYFVLALASQLSATLLIIYRIFRVARCQTHKYGRVVEMVVESAAPNCILLIVLLPFLAAAETSSLGASVAACYPQAILVQSVGIGPTLIAARVAFGMARCDDEWRDSSSILGETRQWTSLTRISTHPRSSLLK